MYDSVTKIITEWAKEAFEKMLKQEVQEDTSAESRTSSSRGGEDGRSMSVCQWQSTAVPALHTKVVVVHNKDISGDLHDIAEECC